jgi:hypothetical protein
MMWNEKPRPAQSAATSATAAAAVQGSHVRVGRSAARLMAARKTVR